MTKPTVLPIWNTDETNSIEPDAAHKLDGWLAPGGVPEKPPFQTFNFIQNSIWKWINEINIKGILGYDALTNYIANFSYVVGSDGVLYHCKINNGPTSSVVNPVGDGTGTWIKTSVSDILTTEGDMVYASAANVLARLAKGAANTKLFMNAGALAPEWGIGIKLGTFTHDVSTIGAQAITGVGFKPSLLEIYFGVDDTTTMGISRTDGTLTQLIADTRIRTIGNYYINNAYITHYAIDTSNYGRSAIVSLDSDGFTITKSKIGLPTGTITCYYKAIR